MNMHEFLQYHPHWNLERFDFHDTAAIENLSFQLPDDTSLLERIKTNQRLQRLECDPVTIDRLESVGLRSANHIASIPEHRFVAQWGDLFSGGEKHARQVHQRAVRRKMGIVNLAITVRSLVASRYSRSLLSDNTAASLVQYFENIPSYQDLFGGLNYCQCQECRSIFSPAAYFLDIMRVVDTYITGQNDIPKGYSLEQRRPDLFNLKLDCANTNDLVPFLQIVDRILSQRVESELNTDAYQVLATARFPFNLPFELPLSRIREYLIRLETTLAKAFSVFLVPPTGSSIVQPIDVARESLGLSVSELAIVLTPDDEEASLARNYGFRDDDIGDLNRLDVFLERTRLNRPQFVELLTQNLSAAEQAAGVANTFFINATGESLDPLAIVVDTTDPQSPFQKIAYLSNKRLDRLNRFIRLSSYFSGSFAELDWSMKAACATEITRDFIQNIASLTQLAAKTSLGFDVLTSFWHSLKTIGRSEGRCPEDLFDRVFNNPALLNGQNPYASDTPFDSQRTYSWDVDGTDKSNTYLRARLGAALQISSDNLTIVARFQLSLLGKAGTILDLNLSNLSSLFRLTKQAALLRQSIDEFLLTAGLLFYSDMPYLKPPKDALPATMETFERLSSTAAWLTSSSFTVYELQYILTGTINEYVFPGYLVTAIRPMLDRLSRAAVETRITPQSFVFDNIDPEEGQSVFESLAKSGFITGIGILLPREVDFSALSFLFPLTSTSFSIFGGLISEAQSKTAFKELVEKSLITVDAPEAESGVLSSKYTPQTPLDFLFTGEPNAEAMRLQVRVILDQTRLDILNTNEVLDQARLLQNAIAVGGLGDFLDTTPEMIAILVPFASGKADLHVYLEALLTPLENRKVPTEVSKMIALLARANLLFVKLSMSPIQVEAVVRGPQYFGIEKTTKLTIADVRSLTTFLSLEKDFQDVNNVLIRCYFRKLPDGGCQGTPIGILSSLTGWPEMQIEKLKKLFWPDNSQDPPPWQTVAGLAELQRVFAMSQQTTMNVSALQDLAALAALPIEIDGTIDEANWNTYVSEAETTLAAVGARCGSDEFAVVFRQIEGKLLALQRDALVGYSIWMLIGNQELAWIRSAADLSQYLLVDIEMSGCDSTSYIAQGITSLQLYLQRARMSLEPGIARIPVPDKWWAWISTYRIWEANRKIYLYPENYVDPELLQDASPIYRSFSDDLLQNEIDNAHVTDAFNSYFTGLAEAADLQPCGSYLSTVEDPLTGADI